MIRYTKEHEKRVVNAIRELVAQHKTHDEMVAELNQQGVFNAMGKDWKPGNLDYFISTRRNKIYSQNTKPASTEGVSKQVIESLLTDPHLNDHQRVKMLSAYINA